MLFLFWEQLDLELYESKRESSLPVFPKAGKISVLAMLCSSWEEKGIF